MTTAILTILLMATPLSVPPQNQTTHAPVTPPSYCDVFRNRARYPFGERVRVSATWTYGFEWSYLSFRDCLDAPRTLVEFVDDEKLCAASKPNIKKIDHRGYNSKADVIVVGELHDCGGCGHMASYRYKFVVTCLESYKKIPPDVP
jgi:hypothetical protein